MKNTNPIFSVKKETITQAVAALNLSRGPQNNERPVATNVRSIINQQVQNQEKTWMTNLRRRSFKKIGIVG